MLLHPDTVILALKMLEKAEYSRAELATKIRHWERAMGLLKETALTDQLTYRLLCANGSAGNVARVIALLQYRKRYPPRRLEFVYAVKSFQRGTDTYRSFVRKEFDDAFEDPTRWLDAILINMKERDFPLDISLANTMLRCYAIGTTLRGVHHVYALRYTRMPGRQNKPTSTFERFPPINGTRDRSRTFADAVVDNFLREEVGKSLRVKLKFLPKGAPNYKVPSRSSVLRLQFEHDKRYSFPLAAAFSFAQSLTFGSCGHDPINLDADSYTALIKACVQRGAFMRAMEILDNEMANTPTIFAYNTIMIGLSKVADVTSIQEYYSKLLANGLQPNAVTVRAVVQGLINAGDLSGAVSAVQDFFNQHRILPHDTTHIDILEIALSAGLVFEAKRYVYFIQQLWHWRPYPNDTEAVIKMMRNVQENPQLQKEALQKLFAYFGEELTDRDFL